MGGLFSIKKKNSGKSTIVIILIIVLLLLITIGSSKEKGTNIVENSGIVNEENVNIEEKNAELDQIPIYSNLPYYVVNNNNPFFYDTDLVTTSYEKYSELDNIRKMRRNNCLHRKRFNANRRKRQYRKCKTNRLANSQI